MKRIFSGLCAAAWVVLLAAGCGGDKVKVTSANLEAFNGAAPELKQKWDEAVQFDKADKYAEAGRIYFDLLRQELTPDQLQAVQAATAAMNQRMYDAAAKGDAAAQQAIDSLRGAAAPPRPR